MEKENIDHNFKFSSHYEAGSGSRGCKKVKRRSEGDPISIIGSPQEERYAGSINMEEESVKLGQSVEQHQGNPWRGRSFIEALHNTDSAEPFYTGSDDEEEDEVMEEQGNERREGEHLPNLSKFPAITSSREEWIRMTKPWRRSIVFKVLGRNMGFRFLEQRLRELWGLKKGFELTDLENGFYIIRFKDRNDYNKVLDGGPWVIQGHYIVIRKWTPEFRASDDEVANTMLWLRLPGLPVQYYDEAFLMKVGNMLGRAVKIDELTVKAARGKYARICVEMDLRQPLTPFVRIDNIIQPVEYEGLQFICFKCGKYGHGESDCAPDGVSGTARDQNAQTGQTRGSEDDPFGPWMIANRRSNRRGSKAAVSPPGFNLKGDARTNKSLDNLGPSSSRSGRWSDAEGLKEQQRLKGARESLPQELLKKEE